MEDRVKVSAVSYVNSYPFIYGLKNDPIAEHIELQLDNPSECASKLLRNEVDIGLVPIAILPKLNEVHIISDYCIGADGHVETVCLFSEVPLAEIDTVLLDFQSQTSVQLVKLLADKHWNIRPKWEPADAHFLDRIEGSTAGVVIGDRTFALHSKFPFVWDLSAEWKSLTGLPFVFACWASNRKLPESFQKQFNLALRFGLSHKKEAIAAMAEKDHSSMLKYVNDKISYDFDDKKRQAMKLFLDWLSKSP